MNRTPISNLLLTGEADADGNRIKKIGGSRFDIRDYGALGGGANDTAAIQDAVDAIPNSGGLLYVPAGTYKYSGETMTLDKKVTIVGDGGMEQFTDDAAISTIEFDSATDPLFDVKTSGCSFRDIHLKNTSGTIPTDGSAILVSGHGGILDASRVHCSGLTISKFYKGIDVESGSCHVFDNVFILDPVLYCMRLANLATPDGGDHSLSNCFFYHGDLAREADAALRIESGGGIKIVNLKVNAQIGALINGIELAVPDNVQTVDLLVANCSIENYTGAGIKGTTGATNSKWGNLLFTALQFAPSVSGSEYAIHLSPTTAGDFTGVCIANCYAITGTSSNPMVFLQNCHNISFVGCGGAGFNDLLSLGTGNTFARSAIVPPGGTTGQSLKKASNNNFDVVWG